MRQIKFRAWDKELKFMVDPSQYFIELDGSAWFNLGTENGGDRLLDQSSKLELMQWTGLTDKNGTEIYEGDIVETDDFSNGAYFGCPQPKMRQKVIWNWSSRQSGYMFHGLGAFKKDCVEVIGNIHQHPSLLTGKDND
jgi:uncharacterized phage protein (TIGR01671 family)